MAEQRFVKIINPADQSIADVPESALPHHYRAGWALLDESPEPDPVPDPKPVRAGKKAAADAAADSDSTEGK